MKIPDKKLRLSLFALIITLAFFSSLSRVHAIGVDDLLGVAGDENDSCKSITDKALDAAKGAVSGAIDSVVSTSVPVHDDDVKKQLVTIRDLACETKKNTEAIRKKEAGQLKVFGITIPGTSWDAIATAAAKGVIERMLDSTVDWINSGFEGRPAFVTDPDTYFTNLADGIAGEFIAGNEDLGFLCSPFQAQIRISLSLNYDHGDERRAFQCTLSEVKGNIEGFFNGDFTSGGGWDTWFDVTQNSGNNPYDSYLEAKVELDSRIARAIGVDEKLLDWGSGFLGTRACATDENGKEKRDANKECTEWGPTVTPGTLIEGQLQKQLGSNVTQLELADEFDELTIALANQLLKKAQSIFSKKGLSASGGNTGAPPPASLAACVPSRQQIPIGESVTWTAINLLGDDSTYSWTGEGLENATTESADVVYLTPGIKSASVEINGQDAEGNLRSVTVNCINNVEVIETNANTINENTE